MIFNKIFHFVKGYVIIKVTGFYIERFLYICAKRGITLINIGRKTNNTIVLHISISDFYKLRPVCRKTGVRVCILKKCGLPFYISKLKKRYFLTVGLLIMICLMFLSSQFIWSVEIVGTNQEIAEDISDALEIAGVSIGAFKPLLPEGEQMKSIIMSHTDNLVWAWVYIKGTKAVIEYKEGIRPPEVVNKSQPCDIIAAKSGVIEKIIEKNGEKRVIQGEAVLENDLLIAGTLTTNDGAFKTVHAIGDVWAYTWHKKSGEYKLYYDKAVPTGRVKVFRSVKLFSDCFDLFFDKGTGFDDYLVDEHLSEIKIGKDNYTGIGIYKKTYNEVNFVRTPVLYENAVENGKNELEELIAKELLPGSRLIEKNITHEKKDEETVKVTVEMKFIENIAKQTQIVLN